MPQYVFTILNGFIVVFLAGLIMLATFKPDVLRKMFYAAIGLVAATLTVAAAGDATGIFHYPLTNIIALHSGGIGIPVIFGYGIGLGVMLNKLRRMITGADNDAAGEAPNEEA